MTALVLSSDLLDNGLNALALANKIVICSTEPTSYATAISTSPLHLLGQSTYAIGDVFNPIGNTQSGRSITSINVSSATVAASGTPVCVAFLDDANSRLLAYGPIAPVAGSTSVTAAATWAVDSYEIMMPGMQYPWPNITSTGGVPSVDLNFVAGRYYGSTMSSTMNRANFLSHFDGTNGSTTFVDATGRNIITSQAPAQIVTSQKVFGSASVNPGNTGALFVDGDDFAFGAGDYTIDLWARVASNSQQFLYDGNSASVTGPQIAFVNGVSAPTVYGGTSAGNIISAELPINTWYHIALTRAAGTQRLFINGVLAGSRTDSVDYNVNGRTTTVIGNKWSLNIPLGDGEIDELRIIKGYAQWTGPFTPPNSAYNDDGVVDAYTYLSCSRASIGYAKTAAGTLTQFGNNQLRITDLGLLVEDARTNTLVRSQEFNTSWTQIGVTVTADTTVAPDGTTTADTITAAATGAAFREGVGFAVNAGIVVTQSIYAKAGSGSPWIYIEAGDGTNAARRWFNLSTGTMGTSSTSGDIAIDSSSIESLANGWYRCSLAAHSIVGNQILFYANYVMANADGSISATVSDTFYAWGAQLEVGAFPSSYIPTTTTSATRAADVVTCIGSLDTVLKSSNISIVADAIMSAGRPTGGSPSLINSSALAFYLYPVTFYSIIRTLDAGVEIGATLGSGADFFGGAKVGLSGDSGGRSIVGNGGSVTSDATAYAALTFAIYLMYGQGDPNSQWWGYFRRLTVWNSRLADATLQALTAP